MRMVRISTVFHNPPHVSFLGKVLKIGAYPNHPHPIFSAWYLHRVSMVRNKFPRRQRAYCGLRPSPWGIILSKSEVTIAIHLTLYPTLVDLTDQVQIQEKHWGKYRADAESLHRPVA